MPRPAPAHAIGTDRGYKNHVKRGELPCIPCLHAHAVYQGDYNKRGLCARGLGWPLLPGDSISGDRRG
jgi:hypothetical protein